MKKSYLEFFLSVKKKLFLGKKRKSAMETKKIEMKTLILMVEARSNTQTCTYKLIYKFCEFLLIHIITFIQLQTSTYILKYSKAVLPVN